MKLSPEQTRAAYRQLPFPVRNYLASEKLYLLTQDLGKRYGIHIDALDPIAEATMNMLLGAESPLQFQTELASLGIPDTTADLIIQELNEKVFKPLRDEIRNAPPEEIAPEEPTPTRVIPTPPPEAMLQAAPVSMPPMPAKQAPPPPAIFAEMMVPEMKGPEPVQEMRPTIPPVPAKPPAPMPMPTPVPAPMPVAAEPVPTPPQSVPVPMQSPTRQNPAPQPVPSANRGELHEVLKKYGVDPYRETPE